jgi:P-type conjugative transfer protein TrbJ
MNTQTMMAAVLLVGTAAWAPAQAATYEVGQGESIQATVDRARPGDTVLVHPGRYAAFGGRGGVRVVPVQPNTVWIVSGSGGWVLTDDPDSGQYGAGPTEHAGRADYGAAGVLSGACASSGAISTAMSAAGSIASIWNGGKATAPLQIAQQIQLVAQRICLMEQLEAQLRNLMNTPLNTEGAILAALAQVRAILGTTDSTVYDLGRIADIFGQQYPEDLGGLPSREIIWKTREWRKTSADAVQESWRLQSQVVQGQAAAQARVGQQLGAVMDAPGTLAAQQGTAQLLGSLFGEMQGVQSTAVAHYRAVEHSIAQEQAKEASAEELHRRAMQGLGQNDRVNVRSPF